ncbi:transcriptional regulator [Tersicoccus solisilvae]|uniref:Transcriptional regulator n=1 Tax=Tersicoccus solisilvae TaxID=1882339 RepID=A0ABQ1NT73_9MICC|nr:ROK family protein [Tersicoccus solisilvae]GGC82160.1 transcriptional regulator [Tersicoccus solisilvae]
MTRSGAVIGLDLGGTKISAGLVGPGATGIVRHAATVPTPAAAGAEAILTAMIDLVRPLAARAEADGTPAVGLGVGAAGVIDPATGAVTAATDHLRGWAGTPVAERLATATGLPVRVVNDVHAHALGEAHHGAGAGRSSVLLVAAGTGLGGALVLEGRVVTGAHGVAGHLGHVPSPEAAGLPCSCGRTGHLEAVASGTGLLERYRDGDTGHGPAEAASGADVARLAATGDRWAAACLDRSAVALGGAIGGWINTLDPDVVIVTGGLSEAGARWWERLRGAAAAETLPAATGCPILPAALGASAALVGAASLLSTRTVD